MRSLKQFLLKLPSWVLLEGILLLFLLIIVFLNLFLSDKFIPLPTLAPKPTSEPNNAYLQNNKPSPTPSQLKFYTYEDATYRVTYPTDWNMQYFTIAGGGNSHVFRPVATPDVDFPRFEIQVTPEGNASSILKIVERLAPYKLTQSVDTFSGIEVTKLDGKLNLVFKTGNPKNLPVHKTFLLFSKNGFIYVITYAYFEDNKNQETIDIINGMLESFQLK